jgi:hypothetical protein
MCDRFAAVGDGISPLDQRQAIKQEVFSIAGAPGDLREERVRLPYDAR